MVFPHSLTFQHLSISFQQTLVCHWSITLPREINFSCSNITYVGQQDSYTPMILVPHGSHAMVLVICKCIFRYARGILGYYGHAKCIITFLWTSCVIKLYDNSCETLAFMKTLLSWYSHIGFFCNQTICSFFA